MNRHVVHEQAVLPRPAHQHRADRFAAELRKDVDHSSPDELRVVCVHRRWLAPDAFDVGGVRRTHAGAHELALGWNCPPNRGLHPSAGAIPVAIRLAKAEVRVQAPRGCVVQDDGQIARFGAPLATPRQQMADQPPAQPAIARVAGRHDAEQANVAVLGDRQTQSQRLAILAQGREGSGRRDRLEHLALDGYGALGYPTQATVLLDPAPRERGREAHRPIPAQRLLRQIGELDTGRPLGLVARAGQDRVQCA